MNFQQVWDDYFAEFYGQDGATIVTTLLKPKSTGKY